MSWIIERVRTAEDLDEVLEIEGESFTNPWTREMYSREFQNPDVSFLYVLRLQDTSGNGGSGRIAGFCSFWLVLDELHINNLAVRTEQRRLGYGTAILQHVIDVGVRRGATRATLEVRQSNEGAIRLYERLGFKIAATRPNYYVSPAEDALILWHGELRGAVRRA